MKKTLSKGKTKDMAEIKANNDSTNALRPRRFKKCDFSTDLL